MNKGAAGNARFMPIKQGKSRSIPGQIILTVGRLTRLDDEQNLIDFIARSRHRWGYGYWRSPISFEVGLWKQNIRASHITGILTVFEGRSTITDRMITLSGIEKQKLAGTSDLINNPRSYGGSQVLQEDRQYRRACSPIPALLNQCWSKHWR